MWYRALIVLASLLLPGAANAACSAVNYNNSLFHPGCLDYTDLNNSWASPPVLGSQTPNDARIRNLALSGNLTMSLVFQVGASTTAGAGLIVPPGVAPTSPANGSIWTTSSGIFVQINGGTIGPLGSGGGGGGTSGGSTNSLQYNAGSGSFGGISLTVGQIAIGQTSAAPSAQTVSGDCVISASGVLTCTKTGGVSFGALASLSTATVATGGTGITSGTSGGVPYYASTSTMASSALLTNNALMMGGGAAAAPKTPLALGTTVQVLHGNAGGVPTWGSVNVATDIVGTFNVAQFNGGTNATSSTCWFGDLSWKTCSSGGSAVAVTDGVNTVTAITSLTMNGFLVSGSGGLATATPAAKSQTSAISYTMAATDMGNVRNINGSSLTLTIPAISSTVFASGMQSVVCNYNATALAFTSTPNWNGYPTTGSGPFTGSIAGTQSSIANCLGFTSNGTTLDVSPMHVNISAILSNVTSQTYTGGISPTAFSLGTVTTGTTTINCGNGPIQTMTNGGPSTLAMSANDGSCVVRITNNGSAGVITFSGFSQGAASGDALTTTNTNKFDIALTRIGGSPHYLVSALQ